MAPPKSIVPAEIQLFDNVIVAKDFMKIEI